MGPPSRRRRCARTARHGLCPGTDVESGRQHDRVPEGARRVRAGRRRPCLRPRLPVPDHARRRTRPPSGGAARRAPRRRRGALTLELPKVRLARARLPARRAARRPGQSRRGDEADERGAARQPVVGRSFDGLQLRPLPRRGRARSRRGSSRSRRRSAPPAGSRAPGSGVAAPASPADRVHRQRGFTGSLAKQLDVRTRVGRASSRVVLPVREVAHREEDVVDARELARYGKRGQYHGRSWMPRGDGTIAPSARSRLGGTQLPRELQQTRVAQCRRPHECRLDVERERVELLARRASCSLRAASDRRRSRLRSVSDGRYQATICSPSRVRGRR